DAAGAGRRAARAFGPRFVFVLPGDFVVFDVQRGEPTLAGLGRAFPFAVGVELREGFDLARLRDVEAFEFRRVDPDVGAVVGVAGGRVVARRRPVERGAVPARRVVVFAEVHVSAGVFETLAVG